MNLPHALPSTNSTKPPPLRPTRRARHPVEIFRDEQRIAILQPAPEPAPNPSFWQALQTYRQTFNIDQNGLDDEDRANLEDLFPRKT